VLAALRPLSLVAAPALFGLACSSPPPGAQAPTSPAAPDAGSVV